MDTQERINTDYIREVKAKNTAAVSTLRMMRAAIKNAEIEKRELLNEEDVIEVIGKEAKKMRDAVETYREANRQEMVDQAETEIELLQSYLPQPLDEAILKELVKTKFDELRQWWKEWNTTAQSLDDMAVLLPKIEQFILQEEFAL